jgi:hypothetical protein
MRRFLPLAALAVIGLTSNLHAQTRDNFALRFNGTTDFVAMPQSITAVNDFTIEMWVNPTATHEIDTQSGNIYDGISGQRYAVYPSHGTHSWGPGHAGAGISIGTNGISVYEHAGDYIPAVLVYKGEINGWTHVALVYRDRVPSLYVNGTFVAEGAKSAYPFVHPSSGDARGSRTFGGIGGGVYGYYSGDLDNVRVWGRAFDAQTLLPLQASTLADRTMLMVSLDMNQTGAGAGLIVNNATTFTNAPLMMTYGTRRSPVFTYRQSDPAARLETVHGDRETISSPLDPVTGEAADATPARVLPSIE